MSAPGKRSRNICVSINQLLWVKVSSMFFKDFTSFIFPLLSGETFILGFSTILSLTLGLKIGLEIGGGSRVGVLQWDNDIPETQRWTLETPLSCSG